MKRILVTVFAVIGLNVAFAADEIVHMGNHHHEMNMMDTRTSLGVAGPMKQHQLSNMRGHVEAIRTIIGLLAESRFDEASKIAHSQLGLTPDMQAMCGSFNNKEFETLGLAFHKSGDELGDTLKTGDVTASLRALNKTMQYCVECHATYRQ